MDPSALKRAFAKLEFTRVIDALNEEHSRVLPDLSLIRKNELSADERITILAALINCAKRRLEASDTTQALALLLAARSLGLRDAILDKRIALLKEAPVRAGAAWFIALQDMQRQLKRICRKEVCSCTDHYQMAVCLGIFGKDKPCALSSPNCEILTVGWYRSWSLKPQWSEIIKLIKRDFRQDYLSPAARVMADFVLANTPFLRWVDFLVPVPPSTIKYVNRGFAPTDLIAAEISRLTCIPTLPILNRHPGVPTRQASSVELARQITVEKNTEKACLGANILLVEDVVTTGRSVSICAGKLRDSGAKEVSAVALAKATRT